MRKWLQIIFATIILSTVGLLISTNNLTGDTSGPNAGKCGAPSDNYTNCTSCHNGSTTVATGWITSDIPASGYIPGTTYTITATATYAGLVRFGFQICPQNTAGVKLGTLVLTSTATTQLVGSSKYVEHKSAGTTGTTGYHTWSFNWIAPAAGSGPLNFYGSFNCANNNGSESGDHIYNSILSIIEGGCSISTVVTANGPTTFCSGGSVTLDAGAGFSTYHWSTNATTQTISVTSSGTYTVTVTNSTGCSVVATSPAIVVNPLPTTPVITAGGATTFCQGGSVTLTATAGATTYHWSTNASTQSINVTSSGSYTVTVTNANGCQAVSATTAVIVNSLPAVPVITPGGPTTFCQGGSVTLTATSGASTYHWSTNASTQSISVSSSGNYTVTVTNTSGCSAASVATVVTVNPLPTTPVITPSGATTFCQGGSVTLSAPSGAATYHWSNNASTQTINISSAGSYTVTVTNSSGCSAASLATVVTVNPLPVPVISGSSTICAGSSTDLNAGAGYSAYHWSTNASTQIITVNTANTYTVTVTNATGCSATASITVTVGSGLSPTITGANSFCPGSNTILTAGAGYSSYHWSTNASTQSITVTAAGTYAVTVTNASGCSGSASVAVTVGTNPTPTISGSTSFCSGSSSVLNAGSGYSSYHWSTNASTQNINVNAANTYAVTVTNVTGCSGSTSVVVTVTSGLSPVITGSSSICAGSSTVLNAGSGYANYIWSTNATTQNITVSAAGTYSVSVSNASGCTGSASKTVTVNANPTPSISGLSAICSGTSAVLNAGTGYSSYHWSTNATTQNISVNSANTYTVTVTNSNGCSGTDSKTVTVSASPAPNITGPNSICGSSNIILHTGSGFSSYHWSNGATTQNTTVNSAGTYSVTVTNATGCSGTDSKIVTASQAPLPTILVIGSAVLCQGSIDTLVVDTAFTNYNWSNGATGQFITVTASGIYSVVVSDASGCTGTSDSVTVAVSDTPNCFAMLNHSEICFGDAVFATADGDTSWSYVWNPGAVTGMSTYLIPDSSLTYILTATNAANCTTSVALPVTVYPLPFTPAIIQSGNQLVAISNGAFTYQWYLNGVGINGATDMTYIPTQSGNYTVIISNSYGCEKQSIPFGYFGDGISTLNNSGLAVFPNPFTDFIAVQNIDEKSEVEILDVQGKVILSKTTFEKSESFDTSQLPSGIYLLKIKTEKEIINTVMVKN